MHFYVCVLGSLIVQKWCFPKCDLWNITCSLKIIFHPFTQILKLQILLIWLDGITQKCTLHEKFKNGLILCAPDPPLSERFAS